MDLHVRLEQRIAEFKRRDAAIYYQTGFAANAGLIPQLVGKGDHLFTDELNHGSIIDGVRLTKAARNIYAHNDMGELEDLLRKAPDTGRRLIITDGVFSMDGDTAPLDEICALAGEYGAMTYVDDAHGEGVLGEGRGIGVHYGVEDKVDIEMGTFSKAFGVVGGLAAGSEHLAKYAFNKSRTFLLSGSAPPATVAACTAALDVLDEEPQHVVNLWKNTAYFRRGLQQLGYDTGVSTTPIIPAMCGSSKQAQALSGELMQRDVFALPIVFPMVARDKARIRVIMNAGLAREDLDEALGVFEAGGKAAGVL
jgi:glycine C-acetyltransferase